MDMNKAHKIITGFFVVATVIIAALVIIYARMENAPAYLEISGINLYYGETCPHCKNVEVFINENNITSKIEIIRKEVFLNETNKQEITQVFDFCEIPDDKRGVPIIYSDGKCYSGEIEAINFLKAEAGVA